MCHGLAFLIQHLIIAYSEEKTKLGKLFEDVSPELATDYDLLRETGINPRSSESFLKLASEDNRRQEAADIFEFLEEVGPGLLILLRSDFLQIAVKYPYHHIAPHSAFLQPQLLDAEGRERIEKEFENEQQADDSADSGIRAELFRVLCGADNGPWRKRFPSGIASLRQLFAHNLKWYESNRELAEGQRIHDKLSGIRVSSDGWFLHDASLGWLSLPSTSSVFSPEETVDVNSSTSSATEIDGSQYDDLGRDI